MEERIAGIRDFRNVCLKLNCELVKLYEVKENSDELFDEKDISGKFDNVENKRVIIHLSNIYNQAGVLLKHDIEIASSNKISSSDALLQRVNLIIPYLERSKSDYLPEDLQDIGDDCIKNYSTINNEEYLDRINGYVEIRKCIIKACKAYEKGDLPLMKKHLKVLKELMALYEILNSEENAMAIMEIENSFAENE